MIAAYFAAVLVAQCGASSCAMPVQTTQTVTTQTTYAQAPVVYAQAPVVYAQPVILKKKFFKRRGCN